MVSSGSLFGVATVVVALLLLVYRPWRSRGDADQIVHKVDTAPPAAGISPVGGRSRAARPQAAGTAPTAMRLPKVPGLDENRFDAVVRDVAQREDPVVDGWDSERLSELADRQLKALGQMLSGEAPIDANHVSAVAVETLQTTFIRPAAASLGAVYADASLQVRRVTEPNRARPSEGHTSFVDALAQQAALLARMSDRRSQFKTVRVESTHDGFATRSHFQISGRGERGAVQVNSVWHASWVFGGQNELPKLAALDVQDYEEVLVQTPSGPLFADCTESVFRNSDRFDRQLIYGIDHWTERLDGAIAQPAAGHGIAIGDVNNDGLEDVYLCQSPGLPNLLLIQNPDGTVTDRAVEAGVHWLEGTRAALLADLDNDGDPDLVAVLGAKVIVQENNGQGVFRLRSIVDTVSSLFAINAVDYDNDRDLDLFICGYTLSSALHIGDVFANPMPFQDANNGAPNVMLRNDGQWHFSDITTQIGLDENSMRFSYASAWEDYDNDGDLDLYVANDFGRNNLYRNEGGRFHDVAAELGVEDIGPGMSASWGDYNNDGRPDLYVSNMFSSAGTRITHQPQFKPDLRDADKHIFQRHARGNTLFENTGNGFEDRSVELAVALGRWAWGSLFVDINNDGWQDIYVTNGFLTADNNNDL
jgi:hypothetical protein